MIVGNIERAFKAREVSALAHGRFEELRYIPVLDIRYQPSSPGKWTYVQHSKFHEPENRIGR